MDNSEKIKAYLEGKMSLTEAAAFEQIMEQGNPDAKRQTLENAMMTALESSDENQLFAQLSEIVATPPKASTNTPKKTRYWLLLLGFIGLLLIGKLSYPLLNPSITEQQVTPVETIETTPLEKEIPTPTTTKSIQKEAQDTIIKSKKAKEQKTIVEPSNPPTKKKTPKIYAANFDTNPLLEKRINDSFRGGDYELTITQPTQISTLKMTNKVANVIFEGNFKTDFSPNDLNINCYIFDNNELSYKSWIPLFSDNLSLQKSGDDLIFSIKKNIQTTPGLYYWIFKDEDTGQLLSIGKMLINN